MPDFRLQPIVDLQTDDTIGFELLAGETCCPDWGSDEWVEWYARMSDALLSHTPSNTLIFVNVDAAQICDAAVTQHLDRVMRERRCVLEWTEHYVDAAQQDRAIAALRCYAQRGVHLAVDDVGDGVDGLGRALRVMPRYIKFSMMLTHRGREAGGEHFLQRLNALFAGLGCDTIAEGIETADDAARCLAAGIRYGQGFWFGDGRIQD